MTKTLVSEAVREMPDEFSIDDLVEKLILIQSFEEGRQQYQTGKVLRTKKLDKIRKMVEVIWTQRVLHSSRFFKEL